MKLFLQKKMQNFQAQNFQMQNFQAKKMQNPVPPAAGGLPPNPQNSPPIATRLTDFINFR